jgi:23S rRNA pseudouridine2605 synthase
VSHDPGSDPADDGERLQKVLAAAGVASRRVVEDMIVDGRIEVDGEVVTELGRRITPDARVTVDGTPVQLDVSKRYVMLNKPTGVVSSMADDRGRPDLTIYAAAIDERVYNVGRLDFDTSGLLLLTNDGELANVLAHPSFGVEKTYVAKVAGRVDSRIVRTLRNGFELEDGFIRADRARIVGTPGRQASMLEITLHSGRNRIVRRMLEHVGHPVVELVRRRFGPLTLGTLASGATRELTKEERGAILRLAR